MRKRGVTKRGIFASITRRISSEINSGFAICILCILFVPNSTAIGQGSSTTIGPVKQLILPGESFLCDGRPAFVLWPHGKKPVKDEMVSQPWVLYSPTLPGYPDEHEKWMHQQFVNAGIAVAGIDVGESYGSPAGQSHFSALYDELVNNRGFAARPCLLGRSRGGLWASSWAISNPDKVSGIAGIYPVFDLQTYPKLAKAAPAYGLTTEELRASLDQHNPINRAEKLAKANIPVFIIHGTADKVVPLKENSQTLLEVYRTQKVEKLIELITVEGQWHNYWPGFFHCQNLVEFVIARANAGAENSQPDSTIRARIKRATNSFRVYKDIEYYRDGDRALLLDLYQPKSFEGRLPVVVWVHGGGWKSGTKNNCPAIWLCNHGYTVASIDYRLIDEAIWPVQINDCRAAIRFLRSNARDYNLNGDRIGAWGSSAGGHLVALLGTLELPENESTSSRVQAVCDWFGPSDLLTMPNNVLADGKTESDLAQTNGARLLGGTVRDQPELAKQASAIYQVSPGDAPMLIMHGNQDNMVPLEQSQKLHAKLKAAGCDTNLIVVEGAGHGAKQFKTPENDRIVLDFFDKHLKRD